jgi:hypothetical protein
MMVDALVLAHPAMTDTSAANKSDLNVSMA